MKTETGSLRETLKTNKRDIITGVVLVLVVAFLADVVEKLTSTVNWLLWLNSVTGALVGLARFAAANLAGWFMLAIAWPSVNRWSNRKFSEAWQLLPQHLQLYCFVAVSIAYLIGACVCFAA